MNKNSIFLLSFPAFVFGTASPAFSQSGLTTIEEIVITANRREQNLQDVGISVSALTGDQMRALGVTTALDVADAAPNIEIIRSYAAPGFNTQITIRGVGQPDFQDTTEATATAYVDEFYMIGAGQADFLTFDIARTEIARGPQGTVQGRNSTAGSINYYTNKPDMEALAGRITTTAGNYGLFRTDGFINIPVSNVFAIRASGSYDSSDGYLDNINPTSNWPKGGESEFYAGRLQALYEPSSDLSVSFKAEYGEMGPVSAGNEKAYPVGSVAGLVGTYPIATDAFDQNQDNTGAATTDKTNSDGSNELYSEMEHYLASINYTVSDNWDVVGLGGYLKSSKYSIEDCDHTPLPICNFSNNANSEHWMAEGRANYDADNIRFTVGANYLNQEITTTSATPLFFSPDITPFVTSYYGQAFKDTQELDSYALFGQAEYDLSEKITVIGGVRYTHDDKTLNSVDAFTVGIPLSVQLPRSIQQFQDFGALVFADPSASITSLTEQGDGDLAVFDKGMVNLNLQLNYRLDADKLLYASYRRGVKSGGFITGNVAGTPANLRPFDEETNNAYEVGFKSTLLDGMARFNAALFYYDYQDMQNTSLIGITNVITNNDAKILGGELELTLTPIDGLNIFFAAGFVDSEVEGINNPTGAVAATTNNELPLAPKYTGNIRIRHTWQAFDGEMFMQGSAKYRSSMYRDSLNNPSTDIPSLFVADALAGYNFPNSSWSVSLFVKNIFDKRRPINLFDISSVANSGEVVYQAPRTYGATVSVSF